MDGLSELLKQLNLAQADANQFLGVYRGYPLGLTILRHGESPENPLDHLVPRVYVAPRPDPQCLYSLLIHVRHRLRNDHLPAKEVYAWGERLGGLLDEGKARVSVEERIAWLTVYEAAGLVADSVMTSLLNAFIDGLTTAGVRNESDLCHYCARNRVEGVSWVSDRAVWICPTCMAARLDEASLAELPSPTDGAKYILALAGGLLVGAAVWAGLWIMHLVVIAWLAEGRGSFSIWVPHVGFVLVLIVLGCLVGAPVGWLVGRVRSPTGRLGKALAYLGVTLAIVLGEIAYATWLVHRETGLLSVGIAFRVLPTIWHELGFGHAVIKLLTAFASFLVAAAAAGPTRRQVEV